MDGVGEGELGPDTCGDGDGLVLAWLGGWKEGEVDKEREMEGSWGGISSDHGR